MNLIINIRLKQRYFLAIFGGFLFTLLLFIPSTVHAQPATSFESTLIFPLQEKHVHSSSAVELPNGDLLSCWFQGSGERTANDVAVMGARLKKGQRNG